MSSKNEKAEGGRELKPASLPTNQWYFFLFLRRTPTAGRPTPPAPSWLQPTDLYNNQRNRTHTFITPSTYKQ